MAHSSIKLPACANCGHTFLPNQPDEFCPSCGQQNHDLNVSFGHVVEETLEGIFHFDSKVFRTAGLLLFRPGQLTRRFMQGHRVSYVPPIRLYIFISFVFFFLLSYLGPHSQEKVLDVSEKNTLAADARNQQKLDSLLRANASLASAGKRAALTRAADSLKKSSGNFHLEFPIGNISLTAADIRSLPEEPTQAEIDSLIRSKGGHPSFLTRLSVKRAVRWRDATTGEVVHQLVRAGSIMMFLLMPLAALLLKGAYIRRKRRYVSHLIFTVHLHCFLFLLFSLWLGVSALPWLSDLADWLWLVPAVYFIVALRTFYEQSWGKTLVKSVLLGATYFLTLALCVVGSILLGVVVF
ncbi:DUF3667 domain-containing protein [Hymenobacter lutimineralis]|uniref:DUF3667 domain-containing protein n=1 Tax=Hymenobacter lutimineralis TaxID=2606448 RepID=A0A5D6V261_9BACT|nr:DUF3667 domain-containing protein [Hymenobacter lutimineralis]TYZ09285.1 DUF3667 domain-containing protein [Hymenobacter lutimineralis]